LKYSQELAGKSILSFTASLFILSADVIIFPDIILYPTVQKLSTPRIETGREKLKESFRQIAENLFVQNAGNIGCEKERSNEMQIGSNDESGNGYRVI
jgi:hypothetical protein